MPEIRVSEVTTTMWWKVQCEARTNKKFAAAGRDASWLWFCANCWAREQLTDGHVPKVMLASLVPGMSIGQVRRAVEKLVETQLAHATDDGGFTIHDFLEHHPSKAKVQAERQADSDRKRQPTLPDSERKDSQTQGDSEAPRTRAGDSSSSISSSSEVKKPHPIKDLLALNEQLFQEANQGEKPAKPTKADIDAANRLITQRGEDKARAIVRQAYVTKDRFIAEGGKSLAFIASANVQNRLVMELAAASKKSQPQTPNSLRVIDEMEAKRHAG